MSDSSSELVVGIDLGTTNSLVGAVIDGRPQLLADSNGSVLLPSVVGVGPEGKVIVGRAARNQRLVDPAGTVVSVKRRMGEDVRVQLGHKQLSPAQVSALILASLLDRAETQLGRRPTRAVITVPAFFNDAQRQATRDAGAIAGLTVERLVNEPTAAALNYHTGQEQTVLVFDFGGGTFDVSVLDRDQGLLEVRTSRGDTQLGGDDIDRALLDRVLEELGSDRALVERDPRAMTRLTEAVERAKIALSERQQVRLFEPFLAGEGARSASLELTLTRDQLEQVARPFVERTLVCIDQALRDASITPRELERVLLVGGSSRIPLVQERVAAHLGRPVLCDPDADRAVALGATLLAGRAAGLEIDEVLVDITPHTLAVGALTEVNLGDEAWEVHDLGALGVVPVIPRDTVVPVERKRIVKTVVDNQTRAQVPIVQGEQPRVGGNTRLGEVVVDALPPSPADSPVEIRFCLDLSGVLEVTATHLPSGRAASVTIAHSPYRLSEQQRRQARAEVEALRAPALGDGSAEHEEPPEPVGPAEAELTLARALLDRADRALGARPLASTEEPSASAALERVRQAHAALERALGERTHEVGALSDALSDALLDLL